MPEPAPIAWHLHHYQMYGLSRLLVLFIWSANLLLPPVLVVLATRSATAHPLAPLLAAVEKAADKKAI